MNDAFLRLSAPSQSTNAPRQASPWLRCKAQRSERKSSETSPGWRSAGGAATKRSSPCAGAAASLPLGTLIAGVQLVLADFLASDEVVEVGVGKLHRFL